MKGLFDYLKNDFYAAPALSPAIKAPADCPPPPPPAVKKQRQGRHLLLSWQPVPHAAPVRYNVYRIDSLRGNRLLAHHIDSTSFTVYPALPALLHSRYAVTAIDAYGQESMPAE